MSEDTNFFRGRGTTWLATRDDNVITGPFVPICQDILTLALASESGEHINKCNLVDAPDDTFLKTSSGTITLTHAHLSDENFAMAALGIVTPAGSPDTVSGEELPTDLPVGAVWFCGGLKMHRNITSLVFSPALVENTDYTLDAASGKVTFLTDQSASPPLESGYGHTDPQSVSILSAAQKSYVLRFEGWNLRNNNRKGSLEIYDARFIPAKLLEWINDDDKLVEMEGTMLLDPSKEPGDTIWGPFGRRVGF